MNYYYYNFYYIHYYFLTRAIYYYYYYFFHQCFEPPRKHYAECKQCIVRLVGQYQQCTNMEYLRGIAHNIGL